MKRYPIFSKTMAIVMPTCVAVPLVGVVLGVAVALICVTIVFGRAL